MNGIMNYILNHLDATDEALNGIFKSLRLQQKTNRSVSIFMGAMLVYTITETIERVTQDKEIKKLSEEIEKLKQPEGE